jgi:hypothetical protein
MTQSETLRPYLRLRAGVEYSERLYPAQRLLGNRTIQRRMVHLSARWEEYLAKVPSEIIRCVCEAYGADGEFIARSRL